MADLLIVDDDRELCALLQRYLEGEQFAVTVTHDGEAALQQMRRHAPDLVLLDVMMPGMDGFETLRRIRQSGDVPVLMLTARGEDIDRIVGLELGADDYLPKPFNHRELLARIRAILRRGGAGSEESPVLEVGGIRLQPGAQQVTLHGQVVELTNTEFELLRELLVHAGQLVSRDALSRVALGRRLQPHDRALDMHMSNLRRKLGPDAAGNPVIRTVRGRGFLLEKV